MAILLISKGCLRTLFAGVFFFSFTAVSSDTIFDTSAIENTSQIDAKKIDLSRFRGDGHPPGTYYVTVSVNSHFVKKVQIDFKKNKNDKLYPELTLSQLHSLGVYFLDNHSKLKDPINLEKDLPGASIDFNFNQQSLAINIPQAYLKPAPDSDLGIPVSQWDEGITALSLNYDASGAQKKESEGGFRADDRFVNLNSGLNFGAWRLRTLSTLDMPSTGPSNWNTNQAWLQRDIPFLRGILKAGDGSSDGKLFDSFSFKGVSLQTENAMYSDKAQGYAPVVRGIARTANARVEISQDGDVIYKRYVPAGPFVISDLYPQSGGGELKVSIAESDGSEHHFTQPWGMVQAMQRPGHLQYSFNAGRTDNNSSSGRDFSSFTLFYGLSQDNTIFGGTLIGADYVAADLGYAIGLDELGSLSADVTQMNYTPEKEANQSGKNYRLQYAKTFVNSGTDLNFSWSFSGDDSYTSFADVIDDDVDNSSSLTDRQKNKLQLSLNQPMNVAGTLTFSAWRAEYWHKSTEENLSLTDSLSLGDISLNFGWMWSQDEDDNSEQQLSISMQIPFSTFSHDSWLTLSSNMQRPGSSSQSVGINGKALEDDTLSWSFDATKQSSDHSHEDASLEYKSGKGDFSTNYSHATDLQSISYEMKGSLIVSKYGVTAGQPFDVNDAIALVKATGAKGLKVLNNPGVVTDYRGYAIIPYIQPYRQDEISLDNSSQSSDVDMSNLTDYLSPTKSAIVIAEYKPHIGSKILASLKMKDGTPVPFGATATADNAYEGIVDETGKVFLSGVPQSGTLTAVWGSPAQTCHAPFTINSHSGKHLYDLHLTCE
ncbi:fimbria/pilus outer membrane usher protein [Enterobacter bugandensis]|uniref:fimbria/pilus outer membrane usher protein n=1 Tax=Enterobacter bugandensis TaxID=881260 RepID=UPI000B49B2EA|nr:fimbria/pilus outer membrane usher protein [Enterobacter bugandensis]QWZ48827.1 fimbrial biogenesis outer membrane usher protein [Enterobacter bugandensis]UBH41101.1 fimbrial biogenesis outer membrane usher protein [Enterobacter bugandensis]UBH92800.1 fimbrial biogenesis outer membrane usher protein [Enterobacter bugandensis]UBH99412.1 fimbrial biogenesis outer membrane usher protein [Enterobacter bugandensis]